MTKAHYLYDEEDVLNAPSSFVGLANSSVETQLKRRNANIAALNEHSPAFEAAVDALIPEPTKVGKI